MYIFPGAFYVALEHRLPSGEHVEEQEKKVTV
jgi:hypothetical protein